MAYSGHNPLCMHPAGCANVCGDAILTATGTYVDGPKQSCDLEEPISITSYAAGSPHIATHLGAATTFEPTDFLASTITPIPTFTSLSGKEDNMCDFIALDNSLDQAGPWASESFNAEVSRTVVCARCKKRPGCVGEASDLEAFETMINNGCCVVRPCDTTDKSNDEKYVQYHDTTGKPVYASTYNNLHDIAERVVFGDDAAPIVVCGATEVAPVATASTWNSNVQNLN